MKLFFSLMTSGRTQKQFTFMCFTFLFRVKWMSLLSTAHRRPRQQPMALTTMLRTERGAILPELPSLPRRDLPKSPTRGTLTRNLLLMDSPSQTRARKRFQIFKILSLHMIQSPRLWSSLKSLTCKNTKHCSFFTLQILETCSTASFKGSEPEPPLTHVFCPTIHFTTVFVQ